MESADSNGCAEHEDLKDTRWPNDLLISIFSLIDNDADIANLRLFNKDWQKLLDASIRQVHINHISAGCAAWLSQLHSLIELDMTQTVLSNLDPSSISSLEALLTSASR